MTVYVDDMFKVEMGLFRGMKMSHMIADTKEELLAMALKIGVPVRHIQHEDDYRVHFDISMSKRNEAIKLGAVEITMRQYAKMVNHRRKTGVIGTPELMGLV